MLKCSVSEQAAPLAKLFHYYNFIFNLTKKKMAQFRSFHKMEDKSNVAHYSAISLLSVLGSLSQIAQKHILWPNLPVLTKINPLLSFGPCPSKTVFSMHLSKCPLNVGMEPTSITSSSRSFHMPMTLYVKTFPFRSLLNFFHFHFKPMPFSS